MITYKTGNIVDVESGFILHGCNAQGVMGSGVAKALRDKYPEIYEPYRKYCQESKISEILGKIFCHSISQSLCIGNAITQEYYGRDGRKYVSYDALDRVFRQISEFPGLEILQKIHMPKIGSGLGGGNWKVVEAIANHHL